MTSAKRKDNKGRILKSGEYQRADLTYEYKYKNLNGKRKSIYAPTLKELRAKERNVQRDLDDGIDTDKGNINLAEQLRLYYSTKNYKPNTRVLKDSYVKNVEQHRIGKMKIKNIKESDCRKFVLDLNKEYSSGKTQLLVSDLKACMKLAVRENVVRSNPFDFQFSKLLKESAKREIISEESFYEFIDFLNASKGKYYAPFLVFLKETGLRVSELLGLTVEMVDFENKCVKVDCQYMTTKEGSYLDTPKTKHSVATIPMSSEAIEAIQTIMSYYPSSQHCEAEFNGEKRHLFTLERTRGTPLTHYRFRRIVKYQQQKYNALHPDEPIDFRIHDLRHLAATSYIRKKVPIAYVKELLRHGDIKTTMGVYTHIQSSDLQKYFEENSFN